MRLIEIFESIENDVSMAKQASEAAYFVSKAIYNGYVADHFVEIGDKGDFLLYDCRKLGLDKQFPFTSNMCILLGGFIPGTLGKSGSFSIYTNPLMKIYRQSIAIHGMKEMTDQAAKKLTNSTEFIEIFRHEFIHALDAQRTNSKIFNKTPPKYDPNQPEKHNNADYYNDAAEFNARYHDITDHLTSLIREGEKGDDISDIAELYGITGDFTVDLKHMLGKNMHVRKFVEWLTDFRRKALLKRLYKLHHHVVELMRASKEPNDTIQD